MPGSLATTETWRRGLLVTAVGAIAVFAGVVLAAAEPASAGKPRVLGNVGKAPNPSCPRSPCEAVGSVTGFQQRVGKHKGVFKIRQDGHIVAWSVDLAKPKASQRNFFGDFYQDSVFGTDPAARLAIVKPKGKGQFKLKRQSRAVMLRSELGSKPVITLNRTLRVKKGDVVALTIPSWLPNFAVEQPRTNVWKASRSPKKCTGESNIRDSRPHTSVGENRRFGCRYTTARLLYWAYLVKDRDKN